MMDVIIIGAGAAGLMCAIEAGKRGRRVLVLDHANKAGKKILMSGGGRCNFTNYDIRPECYLSHNKHFCKSALSRYTQWDFMKWVQQHQIPYHEKEKGQLFCDRKANDILQMLLSECQRYNVQIQLNTKIEQVEKIASAPAVFKLQTSLGEFRSAALVIATGGLSIPTMGASPLGYRIAEQFNLPRRPTRAGLVPFTLQPADLQKWSALAGVSVEAKISCGKIHFQDGLLFTHRGLSGPGILQISSYWQPGETITMDLLPSMDLKASLKTGKQQGPSQTLKSALADCLPKRVLTTFLEATLLEQTLSTFSFAQLEKIASIFHAWSIQPNGTEGYRTAEVTLGGVDCDAISSKTMEVHPVPGLFFIGEVLDVTGWLGGYNFQWAWSSGWAAGQVV